ncbi:MAG: bifunctional phosphoglucose/phosphomannose isomerase [Acidimicrobiia bacterium]|nr:bifunctional phosphoglucose/phosphomannose isomerase [Acidimicrobiia bacterium]
MTEQQIIDSIDYFGMVKGLPEQFITALASADKVDVSPIDSSKIKNIIVLGLGGSGVSGDVVQSVVSDECSIPVIVSKHYELPAFVDESTLVIAASYSGDTEETLSAFLQARECGAQIICVSSGGKLKEYAQQSASIVYYPTQQNLQPRAALGAMSSPIFTALDKLGIYNGGIEKCHQAVSQLEKRKQECQDYNSSNVATDLAKKIGSTIPIFYGGDALGAVAAYRFKCEVNEIAKSPAYNHYYPELCHNEIVGYGQHGDVTRQLLTLVELRNDYEHPQTIRRFEITRDLIRETLVDVLEFRAQGDNKFAQLCDTFYVASFTSVYMAFDAGVDPGPVDIIWQLKNALA